MRLIALLLMLVFAVACVSSQNKNHASPQEIADINTRLAIEYMKQNRTQDALVRLQKALHAAPEYIAANNMIALVYARMDKMDLAKKHFDIALGLVRVDSPDFGEVHNNYGVFLCSQEDKKSDAFVEFMKAAENRIYTTPEHAFENAGACAFRQGELVKAKDYFQQALKRNSDLPLALLTMAQIQLKTEQYLSANNYINRYHKAAHENAQSLWVAYQVNQALKNNDKALSFAQKLESGFPDADETHQLLKQRQAVLGM
ncbi:MAG: type IV pilus biogenesis/stability protein PilW [Gammaproteobacteria bacterium]|nr:type IV pilus biogenesis/stability protein PilW [Gammaproteobacteria bacterium]MDH5727739.1 type IV pilus biogenesis/stability protein PilW [Gammaproteobacteria bacterium]